MKTQIEKQELKNMIKNPKNYFLLIFYFNPNDKRIIVPKRIAVLGWTLNFAKPISYFILLLFALLLIILLSI